MNTATVERKFGQMGARVRSGAIDPDSWQNRGRRFSVDMGKDGEGEPAPTERTRTATALLAFACWTILSSAAERCHHAPSSRGRVNGLVGAPVLVLPPACSAGAQSPRAGRGAETQRELHSPPGASRSGFRFVRSCPSRPVVPVSVLLRASARVIFLTRSSGWITGCNRWKTSGWNQVRCTSRATRTPRPVEAALCRKGPGERL